MGGPFDGVSVLVTGGTRGIGRSIVQAFAADGAKVTFTGTNDAAAAETAAGCPDAAAVRYAKADVSDGAAVKAAVDAAVAHGGGLDVLVNNAGITKDNLLLRMTDEEWDRVQDVNLKGVFLTTRAAARTLMRSKRGRIVNVTSVVGLMGNAGQANYAASKAGLIGFCKSLAREVGSRQITVNVVAPGFVATDMTNAVPEETRKAWAEQIPLGRLGTPDDIASAVCFLASDEASYITGQVLAVNGGMYT